jgi:hypothetical protein
VEIAELHVGPLLVAEQTVGTVELGEGSGQSGRGRGGPLIRDRIGRDRAGGLGAASPTPRRLPSSPRQ